MGIPGRREPLVMVIIRCAPLTNQLSTNYSRTCLAWKGFTKTNGRRSTGQQPGTKSASRPADKPLTNCLSTGDFVPAFGWHKMSLVRASGKTFKRFFHDALEGTRDACLLGGLFCLRPVLTDPAPPPRRALRPDPPVVRSGFGLDRWCCCIPFL